MRTWLYTFLTLFFALTVGACAGLPSGQGPGPAPTTEAAPSARPATPTTEPSPEPSPTATPTRAPLTGVQPTSSPSPERSCPMQGEGVISPDIAANVVELSRWGRGRVESANEGAGGAYLFVETPIGVYIRERSSLRAVHFLPDAGEVALSPDGTILAAAFADSHVEFWSLAEAELLGSVEPGLELPQYPPADFDPRAYVRPTSIAFSPDNDHVAIAYGGGTIGLFSAQDQSLVTLLISNISPQPERILFSPRGTYLMSIEGERESHAALWDVSGGEMARNLPGLQKIPERPFSPDETEFLTSRKDGSVLIRSVVHGGVLQRFGTGWRWPEVEYSEVGQYYVVQNGFQIRRARDGQQVTDVEATDVLAPRSGTYFLEQDLWLSMGHFPRPFQITLAADGALNTWSVGDRSFVRWWPDRELFETHSSSEIQGALSEWRRAERLITSRRVKASLDGSLVGICTYSNLIVLSVEDNRQFVLGGCGTWGNFGFPATGQTVWIAGDGSEFQQYGLGNNRLLHEIKNHTSDAYLYAPLGDGSLVLTSSQTFYGGNTFVWNADPFYKLGELTGIHHKLVDADYAPDAGILATADSVLKIWDARALRQMESVSLEATAIALSASGDVLAAGTADGAIHLISVPEGEELAVLEGHKESVTDLLFSDDQRSLYSVSQDGTVRLWGLPAGESADPPNCTGAPYSTEGGEPVDLLDGVAGEFPIEDGRLVVDRSASEAWYGFRGSSRELVGQFDLTIEIDGRGEHYMSLHGRLPDPGASWWGEGMHALYVGRYQSEHLLLRFYDGSDAGSYEDVELPWQDVEAGVAFTLRFFDPQGQFFQVLTQEGDRVKSIDVTQLEAVDLQDGLFPDRRLYPGVQVGPGGSLELSLLELEFQSR